MANFVRMTVEDRDLQAALLQLPLSLRRKPIIAAMKKRIDIAVRRSKRTNYGFTDRSGRLRKSIRAYSPKGGTKRKTLVSGIIGSNIPYAAIIEFNRKANTSFIFRALAETDEQGFRIFDNEVSRWLRNINVRTLR